MKAFCFNSKHGLFFCEAISPQSKTEISEIKQLITAFFKKRNIWTLQIPFALLLLKEISTKPKWFKKHQRTTTFAVRNVLVENPSLLQKTLRNSMAPRTPTHLK